MSITSRCLHLVPLIALAVGCASTSETTNTNTTKAPGSSTSFVSSWKSPSAQPMHIAGAKVAAVVLMSDLAARRTAEDKLASELSARGAQGVPMYTLMEQSEQVQGEPIARDALQNAEVAGVVVMHPTGSQQEVKNEEQYGKEPYNKYWSGYYEYGFASPYVDPGPSYDTVVSVETLIYSLKQNQLVWAGTSKTTNPASLTGLIGELAAATANELSHLALVAQ